MSLARPQIPTGVSTWPHIGRPWVVVIAATIAMLSGFFAFTTVSVFMLPLIDGLGWQKGEVSSAYFLMSAGAAVGGLLFGCLSDRLSTRLICVFGASVIGVSFIILSQQRDITAFMAAHAVMGLFGCACLYAPVLSAVSQWFDKKRGLAMGIVTAGGTIGQGIAPGLLQPVIETWGWQTGYALTGLVFLVAVAPAMWLVDKPPPSMNASNGKVIARWPVKPAVSLAWLGVAAFLCCTTMAVPLVHVFPLMIECGRSPTMAGALLMFIMAAGTAGRLAFGLLADRIGALGSYLLASLIQTVTLHWFIVLESTGSLFTLGAVFGFGFAGVMTTLNLSIREAAPPQHTGEATAIIGMLAWVGMGTGGGLAGHAFDLTGSYQVPFIGAAIVGLLNLVVLAGLYLLLSSRTGTKFGNSCRVGSLAR